MKFTMNIPVTRRKTCKEGFYLLINGTRTHFTKKSKALGGLDGVLKGLNKFQVCTVREYLAANRKKIERRMAIKLRRGTL